MHRALRLFELLEPPEDDVEAVLAGNLCRCAGYVKVVEAVTAAPQAKRQGGGPPGFRALKPWSPTAMPPASNTPAANAIYDAVGTRVWSLPITLEKVLKALRTL